MSYSHTRALRNPIIKKLYHGILDFGLRNYGAPTWGSSSERFLDRRTHNPLDPARSPSSSLLCLAANHPTPQPPTIWSSSSPHASPISFSSSASASPSLRARPGAFGSHARADDPSDGFAYPLHGAGQAQKALRNYGEAAAAASETLNPFPAPEIGGYGRKWNIAPICPGSPPSTIPVFPPVD